MFYFISMLIIRTNQPNTMVVTVSQNSELTNPEYLFSFVHIFSKERVSFIPTDISTHKSRYDEFYFVEGTGVGEINFPYAGLYLYGIWEQPAGSGNLDPSLATNVVENGEAQIIVSTAITTDSQFDIFISNNEDNSNIIFAPDEPNPTPNITPSITPSPTTTPLPVSPTPTPSITPTNTPSVTPTNTPSYTPTLTPTPSTTPSTCFGHLTISGDDTLKWNGTYDLVTNYSGGTILGGWFNTTTFSFVPNAFSGDGRTYAVYQKIIGSNYYTAIFNQFGNYQITETTQNYLQTGVYSQIDTFGTFLLSGQTTLSNGVYYPNGCVSRISSTICGVDDCYIPISFIVSSGITKTDACNNLLTGTTFTIYAQDLGNCTGCLPSTCWPCLTTNQKLFVDQNLQIPVGDGYYANDIGTSNNTWYILGGYPQGGGFMAC